MKRLYMALSFALLPLMAGCGLTGPGAKITSVKYVNSFQTEGVEYTFQGKKIVKMELTFRFDETFAAGLDSTSDDYRRILYSKLVNGAHFYIGNEAVKPTYGFWPQKAGKDFAKEMTLFYVIPNDTASSSMRFTFDTSMLGKNAPALDTAIYP